MPTLAGSSTHAKRWLAALGLSTGLGACALGPQLVPAPDAQTIPGQEKAAVAQAAGVRMTVVPDAWQGYPDNLEDEITPLKLTIENNSQRALRLRYNEFVLDAQPGVRYSAIPPLKIEGAVLQSAPTPVYTPRFAYSRFYMAPYYHPFYGAVPAWGHPWAYDPLYYDRYYPTWRVELPTRDMQEMAIPEGVLEPGGSVSGFLYFPRVAKDSRRVVFIADLHSPGAGEAFGKIRIPFIVK